MEHKYRHTAALLVLLCLLLCACQGAGIVQPRGTAQTMPEPTGMSYFGFFDTVSYVYNYAGDSAERFEDRSADVAALLEEYHQLFDIYHEYSGVSNLCTVNKYAGGEAVKVDRRLIDFMLYARELYELTGGEMDIMMGAVLRIWHDCREDASENPQNGRIPTLEELEDANEHTGFQLLEIDEENCTLRITDPEASIDVGALGKGYATEQAAQFLEQQGAYGYVLNVGGNIRCIGTKPDGSGWATGIRHPEDDMAYAAKIEISDTSCVTSGVYERYFTVDGRRYHHIIDKDTLYPAEYYSSLTVLCKDSTLADALSTALFCMDMESGQALADRIGGIELVYVTEEGELYCTKGVNRLDNTN